MVFVDRHSSYLQLYVYDIEHKLENCVSDSERLNPSIIAQLMGILSINLYYTFFCTLDDSCNLKIQEIWIRSNVGLDQQVFNAPSSSQVATIWVENDAPS